MIVLFKGDDTGGTFGRSVQIKICSPGGVSLDGCRAEFIFGGITKSWTDIVSGEYVELFYSHNETGAMSLGDSLATFRIIDSAGKIRTVDNTVPVCVTNRVDRVYPGSSKVTFSISQGGGIVRWDDIVGKPATVVQTVNNQTPDAQGNVNVGSVTVRWEDIIGKPNTVVQTVNHNAPDENGNVDVEGGGASEELIETVSNLVKAVAEIQLALIQINAKFQNYSTSVDTGRSCVQRSDVSAVDNIPVPIDATTEEVANKVNAILSAMKTLPTIPEVS